MVYDNDCKYPLFKARLIKEEDKEHDQEKENGLSSSPETDPTRSSDSLPKEKGLYAKYLFHDDFIHSEQRFARQLSQLSQFTSMAASTIAASSRSLLSSMDSTHSTPSVHSPREPVDTIAEEETKEEEIEEEEKEEKEEKPMVVVDHEVYGVYWLNDSCVAVVMTDRLCAERTRVLAVGDLLILLGYVYKEYKKERKRLSFDSIIVDLFTHHRLAQYSRRY